MTKPAIVITRSTSTGTTLVPRVFVAVGNCRAACQFVSGVEGWLFTITWRGLHPKASARLLRWEVAKQRRMNHTLPVVIFTDPWAVDVTPAEELLVCRFMRGEGRVVARFLSEHPDYERWKNSLSTGEFWSSVGEGWVED